MIHYAARSVAIASLLISGCDFNPSKQSTEGLWRPFVQDLESTVSTYPEQGIIVVFGSETSATSKQNRRELEKMAQRLTDVANIVLVYANASRNDSDPAQVLKMQGLTVPANLLYDPSGGEWEVLPEIIDSSTRKEVYMRASWTNREGKGKLEPSNKERQETASPLPVN